MTAVPASQPKTPAAPLVETVAPSAPGTLDELGLSGDFVRDLLLKVLYVQGARTAHYLAEFVKLPFAVVDDELLTLQQRRFIEVRSTKGPNRASYVFDLGDVGRGRARDALEVSQYVGPAPVPLAQYRIWIEKQTISQARVNPAAIRKGFSHLVLPDALIDSLGPAVNSAKSIFLYGHPGNGKTAIAEAISQMLGGTLYVPYAVDVDGQIMLVYDPVYHDEAEAEGEIGPDSLWIHAGPGYDRRYAKVKRPVVLTGGELTLEQLDLQYDPFAKVYQAPFQVKANGGVLIIDDFGRQRVPPRDLLNRWIVPLEKGTDFLTLHTGGKFPIPFDCLLIFATNLDPQALVEEAFMRRIHYKIQVPDPTREQYEEIFRRFCAGRGVHYEQDAVNYVFREFYERMSIPPRSCHPRDIISHLDDTAKYLEVAPYLTFDLIDKACRSYFLAQTHGH